MRTFCAWDMHMFAFLSQIHIIEINYHCTTNDIFDKEHVTSI
jgi:hypothetical protein